MITKRRLAAVFSVGIISFMAATATTSVTETHASAGTAARCTSSQVTFWMGWGRVGAAAGTSYRPLEFSNISGRACWLSGYPKAYALDGHGHRFAGVAYDSAANQTKVVLQPGQTAHIWLGIWSASNVCGRSTTTANGIALQLPASTRWQHVNFSFLACQTKTVLMVHPFSWGVAIPGFAA